MMVSSPAAGDPYAAAAALDRTLRSHGADGGGDASAADSAPPDGGPDVVVTLSQGGAPPSTYGPSGRMAGPPTLDDMGANGPSSLVKATESDGDTDADDAASPDATADADADTAVAA